MPSFSKSSQSSAWIRGSSPLQNEQNGSSSGSPGATGSVATRASDGNSSTRARSQSAHRVNPWRYSALHCGQSMAARQVYYSAQTAINPDGTLFALTRLTASTQRQTENSLNQYLRPAPTSLFL